MQLSLLDQLSPHPDVAFQTARRIVLDQNSWVEHVPDWLSGHDQMRRLLLETADWEQHRRNMYDRVVEVPRLVAGAPGSRLGLDWRDGEVRRFPSAASPGRVDEAATKLAEMAALLSIRYRRVLDSVSLAHYRGGKDSVAFHGDKMGPLRGDTVIAIVSVGERRRFLLRRNPKTPHDGSSTLSGTLTFQFGGGDLLVMGGACQRDYEHAIPKMNSAGSRIAIMFREKIPEVATVNVERRGGSSASTRRSA